VTAESPNPSTDLFGDRRTVEQVEEGNELAPKFDAQGLIPCVTTDFTSGEVLMMAWLNAESLAETLSTGRVCYYSRSRKALWRKGETSGQVQMLVDLRLDCDGDTILLLVDQQGVACHTGRRNCFYRAPRGDALADIADPLMDPEALYRK
jgi:phosphoribosyl-AMP cyclohydrolase